MNTQTTGNPLEQYKFYIDLISDIELKNVISDFIIFFKTKRTDIPLREKSLLKFLRLARNLSFSELSLEKFQELFESEANVRPDSSCSKILRLFFAYIFVYIKYPKKHSKSFEKLATNHIYSNFIKNILLSNKFLEAKVIASFFESFITSTPFCFRFYKTEAHLTNVKDKDLRLVLKNFVEFLYDKKINQDQRNLYHMLISLQDIKLSELNPHKFKEIAFVDIKENSTAIKLYRVFFGYLLKFTDYISNFADYFIYLELYSEIVDIILHSDVMPNDTFFKFLSMLTEYRPFILHLYSPAKIIQLIPLNTTNPLLIRLFNKLCKNTLNNNKCDEKFFELFTHSCSRLELLESITDFNYTIFKEQFEFFDVISRQCIKQLIYFYLMILNYPDGKNIFKIGDPIDKNMLMRLDFYELYSNGFELVMLNKHEPCPTINKWVLNPNAHVSTSTRARTYKYYAMDFDNIENSFYRDLAKAYFWQKSTNVASSVYSTTSTLTILLNYLSNLKKLYPDNTDSNIYQHIIGVDIYNINCHLQTIYTEPSTFKGYITVLKDFLIFAKKHNLLKVDNICFEYLRTKPSKKYKGGERVPDDILFKLQSHLLGIIDDSNSPENLIHFVIFQLLVETNIRPSQLLSLKISQIVETMKKGQFMICSTTKTSNGQIEETHISAYAHRYLETVIKHTDPLRKKCTDPELKDCIFLTRNKKKLRNQIHTITVQSFNRFIKKQCDELSFPSFTTGNLRDTHMTLAREYVKKNNLNKMHEKELTGHANSTITDSNYIDKDIKTFIEATHGILIGDVDIKGEVNNCNNTKYDKSVEVEKSCGFCGKDSCDTLTPLITCLLCDGFKAYLDRIPFFEARINELDKLINQAPFEHDRQHLQSLKRLFCAYLAKLYTLKENQNA